MSNKRSRESEEFIETSARTIESELKKKRVDQLAEMAKATGEISEIYNKLRNVVRRLEVSGAPSAETTMMINRGLDEHFPKSILPMSVVERARPISEFVDKKTKEKLEADKAKHADFDAKKRAAHREAWAVRHGAMKRIVAFDTEKLPSDEFIAADETLKSALKMVRDCVYSDPVRKPESAKSALQWNLD